MLLTSRWEDWHYISPSNRAVVGLLAMPFSYPDERTSVMLVRNKGTRKF